MERSDLELLDAWRGGDATAGSELFARHFDAVCRFFRNKVSEGTDDLIQRTFLAMVESRDRFRGDSSFRTYLFTVARNELFAHLRKSGREQARFDPLEQSVYDLGPTPTTMVAQRKEQRLLLEALRRVPLDLQVALELFYWEDMSASELARMLELPEGTVRTRIRRARQLLEQALQELAEGDADLHSTLAGLDDWAKSLREHVRKDE
ncbi:MAG TPA: sigma-70 family RNA polymerase sigma factor [Nannocystaceae bacterium]|nr:sigma-70 family RNA polymerase sigma factor [Nannocystaceae bacterium]